MAEPKRLTFSRHLSASAEASIGRDDPEPWPVIARILPAQRDFPGSATLTLSADEDRQSGRPLLFFRQGGHAGAVEPEYGRTVDLRHGEEALLVADRDAFRRRIAKAGGNVIDVEARISRSFPDDPADSDQQTMPLRLRIGMVRMALGDPKARLDFDRVIDLDGKDGLRDHIRIARILVESDEDALPYDGPECLLQVDAAATLDRPGAPALKLAMREVVEGRAGKDGAGTAQTWGKAVAGISTATFVEPARTPRRAIDVAIPRMEAWGMLRAAGAQSGEFLSVSLKAEVSCSFLRRERRHVRTLVRDVCRIALKGTFHETVTIRFGRDRSVVVLKPAGAQAGLSAPVRALWRRTATGTTFRLTAADPLLFEFGDAPDAAQLSFSAALHLAGADPRRPRATAPHGCPEAGVNALAIPLRRLVMEAAALWEDPWGDWICRIAGTLAVTRGRRSSSYPLAVEIPVRIEKGAEGWAIVVDVGTSATAVRIGRMNPRRYDDGFDLLLGDWLSRIDRQHDESPATIRDDDASPPPPGCLLPSHVGLSPDMNLRARHDILSLPGLCCSRDALSVPFPSAERMPEHVDDIVFGLKRKLAGGRSTVRLSGEAPRLVDVGQLLKGYLRELGDYVVPNVVLMQAEGDDERAKEFYHDWREGLDEATLVLTHPSGLETGRRAVYREAGAQFLEAVGCGRAHRTIVLVPEALAALRYGLDAHLREAPDAPSGRRVFVALDIGAGTCDVTVLAAQIDGRRPVEWESHAHFGVTLGGHDLDRALLRRIAEVLAAAAQEPAIRDAFDVAPDPPSSILDLGRRPEQAGKLAGVNFLKEFRAARAGLANALLRRDAPYRWRDGDPPLPMRVGRRGGSRLEWPVVPKAAGGSRRNELPVYGVKDQNGAELGIEDEEEIIGGKRVLVKGGRIVLRLPPAVFAAPGHLADLIALMGHALPSMALRVASELTGATTPGRSDPPLCIVTGRAALWPPLFDTIAETVAAAGGRLILAKPFEPDRMKRAVIRGALQIAREPWLNVESRGLDPLAVMTMNGEGEPAAIRYVPRSSENRGEAEMTFKGDCRIARAAPGLNDALLARFRSRWLKEDVRPWDIYAGSFNCPRPERVRVRWTREADADMIVELRGETFEADFLLPGGSQYGVSP